MSDTRKYRKFSAQQKTELVLASLRGPKTIAQLSREHDISETLLRRWREQFLAGGGVGVVVAGAEVNVAAAGEGLGADQGGAVVLVDADGGEVLPQPGLEVRADRVGERPAGAEDGRGDPGLLGGVVC